jgi:hypothetical protein
MRFVGLFLGSLISVGVVASLPACSSDKSDGDGTGGGSSTGGKSSGGGSGTGGAEAADPSACGIEYEGDECRTCLASYCCDSTKGCLDDATCKTEFETYRTCVKDSNGDGNEISLCYSALASMIGNDHQQFITCDYQACGKECGGIIPL